MDQSIINFLQVEGEPPHFKVVVYDAKLNHLKFNKQLRGTSLDGRFLIPWDGVRFDGGSITLWFSDRIPLRFIDPKYDLQSDVLTVTGTVTKVREMFTGSSEADPVKASIMRLDDQDMQLIELIKKYGLITYDGNRLEEIRRRIDGKRVVNRVAI